MDNKELNIAIYKSLAAKAAELFQRTKIETGTYSSKELADGKKDKKHLCWEMENGKEEITISVESFVCRFVASMVFTLLARFEKLVPVKERVKFTKCEEMAGLVCSFTMDVSKSAINAAKFVSKDIWRDSLANVCINIHAERFEASDGYKLVTRPVEISNVSGELLERRVFIRPNDLKNMVGRCEVCVYSNKETFRTVVTAQSGETFICECEGLYPNVDSVSWKPEEKQAIRFADLKGLKKIAKDAAKLDCKLQIITEAGNKSAMIVAHHFEEQCFEYSVPLSEAANYSCDVWINPENFLLFFGDWTGELYIKAACSAFVLGSKSGCNLLMPVIPEEGYEVKDPEYSIEPVPEIDAKQSNPLTELQAEPVFLSNRQIIATIWLLGLFAIGRRLGMVISPVSPWINIPSATHAKVLLLLGEIHIRAPGKVVITYRHKIRNISDGKSKHIGTYWARGPDIPFNTKFISSWH